MIDESPVDGHEAQTFHLALREQHAVERVAGGWLGHHVRQGVACIHLYHLQAHEVSKFGRSDSRPPSTSLPKRTLIAISQRLAALT